ncbi:MAG: hypothetical protein SPI30_04140 [Prevotella sp.]|nr:hypothetical protein [Prevotella sp.]
MVCKILSSYQYLVLYVPTTGTARTKHWYTPYQSLVVFRSLPDSVLLAQSIPIIH